MDSKHIALAVVAVVALSGIVGAMVMGIGPIPGGDDGALGGSDETSTPYEDTVVMGDGDGTDSTTGTDAGSSSSEGTAQESEPPFSFVIDKIEKCGQRCRNVTATITNNQNETATGVTVRSEIYTGENYNNKIWEGSSDAGDLAPDESYTDKKQVKLGYSEAYAVQQNNGEILIKTYIVTDDRTYVFEEKRDVA